jgi:molybdenum-dependent DNA-binding transcriptional regulator ModE
MMEEMEPTSRFHSEMEELLRPRIKPKVPASLKQNVLQAIEHESPAQSRPQHAARRISAWWAAAAVLLIGVLTFALWPKEKEPQIQLHANGRQVAVQNPHPQERKVQSDILLSPKRRVEVGRDKSGSTTPAPLITASSQFAQKEAPQTLQPVLESEETMNHPPIHEATVEALTPYEQQLLANFEANRDFVNAYLAEEFAQVRFMQQRLGQSTQQYLQQYRELQQRITEQIREDIDNIAPKEQSAEEV